MTFAAPRSFVEGVSLGPLMRAIVFFASSVFVAFGVGLLVIRGGTTLVVLAGAALFLLILILTFERAPAASVTVGALFLPFAGFARRLVEPTHQGVDVFTAATAIIGGLFFILSWRRNTLDSRLSRVMALYWLLLVLEIFNPLSGGIKLSVLATGFASLPLVWFFVGRVTLTGRRLEFLVKAIGVAAIIVALYGLKQEFIGFSSNELEYLNQRVANGYQALSVSGTFRPLSTLSNSAEYAHLCGLGAVCCLSFRRLALRIPSCALLLTTVFLAGSRGIFVFTLLAVAIATGAIVGKRLSLTRILGIGAIVLALGALALAHVTSGTAAPATPGNFTSASIDRSEGGLSHPFDASSSTLPIHIDEAQNALDMDATRVLGVGSGGLPFASLTTSATIGTPSEVDLIDRFAVLGYPGIPLLVLLIVEFVLMGLRASRLGSARLRLLSVLPLVLFNAWFSTAEYSVNAIFWLLIGGLDAVLIGKNASS